MRFSQLSNSGQKADAENFKIVPMNVKMCQTYPKNMFRHRKHAGVLWLLPVFTVTP